MHVATPTHQRRALLLEAVASVRAEHVIRGNVCYSHQVGSHQVGSHDAGLPVAEDPDLDVRFLLGRQLPVLCPPISHLHRSTPATRTLE